MSNSFFENVLVSILGKITAQRGNCAGAAFNLLEEVSAKHVTAGNTALSDADADGEGRLSGKLRKHSLPCTEQLNQVVIWLPKILAKLQGLS